MQPLKLAGAVKRLSLLCSSSSADFSHELHGSLRGLTRPM